MAISSLSAIGGSPYSGFRVAPLGAIARPSSIEGIESVPAALARGTLDPKDEEGRLSRLSAKDPRRPESLLAGGARALDESLDELRAQRSSLQKRQAEEKGERSAEVLAQISQLKARDGEVRAHESAHIAAGGRYITGGASYSYQKGPDGAQYAVGGEVGIDSSPLPGRPEETAEKMRIVRAAALAPSDPSGADLAVAAAAAQAEAQALADMVRARMEEAAARYAKESRAGKGDAAGRRAEDGRAGGVSKAGLDMVA